MAYHSKILLKINGYLYQFITHCENAVSSATDKEGPQKIRKRNSKTPYYPQASPDCFHTRATVRRQENIRHNPAP